MTSRLIATFMMSFVLFIAARAEGQGSVEQDRAALVALYDATNGPNWGENKNWKTDQPLSTWHGVITNRRTGRVGSLSLIRNNLTGEIPRELGSLTDLSQLSLFGNNLTGEIPRELGNLTDLHGLVLSRNDLTGEIPRELGSLTNLASLGLVDNNLTGEIPRELGSLTNLEALDLRGNNLTSAIPRELGGLTNLRVLHLGGNNLTGAIPRELGGLTNLRGLHLYDNNLTGEIPRELGSLTNLGGLNLYNNNLTGEIPRELGSLMNLVWLTLQDNNLTGEIPRELGDLADLETLRLRENRLTGEIPSELARFEDTINPQQNGVILPIEGEGNVDPVDSAAEREALGAFYDATGGANWTNNEGWKTDRPLSEWHGVTTRVDAGVATVTGLSLPDNNLTGEIPARLADLPNLETLVLNGNSLTGTIPEALRRFESTINPQAGGVILPVGTPVPALPAVATLLLACSLWFIGRRRMGAGKVEH